MLKIIGISQKFQKAKLCLQSCHILSINAGTNEGKKDSLGDIVKSGGI